jgi:hypothetical protein
LIDAVLIDAVIDALPAALIDLLLIPAVGAVARL